MAVLKARIGGAWVPVGGGPSGGGTDEVVVSATEPPLAETELWYDTSAASTPFGLTANPNNALGIVAMGAFKSGMANPTTVTGTDAAITEPLTMTMLVGRRYRIVCQLRAVVGATSGAVSLRLVAFDGATDMASTWGDLYCTAWYQAGGAYDGIDTGFVVDGDGLSHSITIHATTTTGSALAYFDQNCRFYVEDTGPNSAPAVLLPSGVQMITGAGVYQTDANGDATVNLPVGGKLTAAVANGSQSAYPMNITTNLDNGVIGGNKAVFRVRNADNAAPAASTYIGLSYMITYTY